MTTILSAQMLLRATPICGSADRANLTGALVEPIPDGGAWIVATTGQVMLIQRDRTASIAKPLVLRMTLSAQDERLLTDGEFGIAWSWDAAQIHIPDSVRESPHACPVIWPGQRGTPRTHVIIEEACPATQFPAKWRQAIGASAPNIDPKRIPMWRYTGYNPALLDLLAGWSDGFRLRQRAPGKATIVSFDNEPDALGVIMPRAMYAEDAANLRGMLTDLGHAGIADGLGLDADAAMAEKGGGA